MKKMPNILFILTDDQGPFAMHCAGNDELYTPNLDRIAKNGRLFDNFFCASPVCSPARASLMTGNIPSAHGVHDWIASGNVDKAYVDKLELDNPYGGYFHEDKPIQYLKGQTTYTDVLTEHGYTCALSGKWHLGDSLTPQHGFKYWYTIGKGGCCYYHPDMIENGTIVMEDGKYVTNLITDKALTFLDDLSAKENPFYLSVHYTAPHSPWEEEHHPKKWIDYYNDCEFKSTPDIPDHPDMTTGPVYGTSKRRTNLRGYYASISAMDEDIGRLLDRLEEQGIADNTIVIFTSDNGMSMGHHGIWGKGNGTFPQNMYDTAVKVPFLISHPNDPCKGTVCNDLVSAYDFFPTLIDLLNLPSQSTVKLPGKSFVKSFLTDTPQNTDNCVVIYDEYGPVRMIRTSTQKYIHRYPYGYHEFYDLVNDPNEEHNLIDSVEHQDDIFKLRKQLELWFYRYVDPARDGTKEEVSGLGQLCSAGIYSEKTVKYIRE